MEEGVGATKPSRGRGWSTSMASSLVSVGGLLFSLGRDSGRTRLTTSGRGILFMAILVEVGVLLRSVVAGELALEACALEADGADDGAAGRRESAGGCEVA